MHGLLQDELGVYSEDKQGRPVYNFQYIDAVYDAILNTGMRPFVEFGFMPQRLASGEKTIFWWKGNITPPRDYAKWERLVHALVQHWTNRYGRDEVRQWYFEVWNEPNLKDLFWSGDQAEYFKLYDATVRAIKSVSTDYRVGGPATAGRGWVREMIDHAAKTRVPLDFVTTHDYGVTSGALDAEGTQQLFLDPSPDAIVAGVREVRAQIKASRCRTCRCITPSGARRTRRATRSTTHTSQRRTFSRASKARRVTRNRCLTGPSPTSSRRTGRCRRPFTAASG